MRTTLTASLFVALGFMCPVSMSFPALTEDSEGSGYNLDSSGSGDWSGQGEIKNVKDHPNSKDVRIFAAKARGGIKNTLHDPSDFTFDTTHWLAKDNGSGYVVANSKSFLENKEIFAGIVAGGVIGVTVAAALAALIYKWQKKDGGYILGQQRASDDYHEPDREVVVD